MKDWFKARNIWGAAIMALSDAEAGRLAKALWTYTMTGEQQNLSGAEKGIFAMILLTLSQDDDRESEISAKRAVAGSLGGKQRQAKEAFAEMIKQNEAKQANATNKNIEKEGEKEKEKSIRRFTPPTLDEVKAYCTERQNKVDPEKFVDFYASKGWRVGNQPMKDWQAAVRTWEKGANYGSSSGKSSSSGKPDWTHYSGQRSYEGLDELVMQNFIQMCEDEYGKQPERGVGA